MNNQTVRHYLFVAALLVLLVITGCGRAPANPGTVPASALSEAEARAVAEAALDGLNAGDYAAWSRDWSAEMKAAIAEADFLAFRDNVLATYGPYVSIGNAELTPGQQAGNVRWEFTTDFEQGQLLLTFVFAEDGREVTGLHSAAVE